MPKQYYINKYKTIVVIRCRINGMIQVKYINSGTSGYFFEEDFKKKFKLIK